jgi:hypothetical protein
MNTRRNAASSDSGIALYREAIGELKRRGEYSSWVNVHQTLAIHNSADYFLAWHRAYLYYFELRIGELVSGATLPYWDWTRLRTIPPAFTGRENPLDHPRNPGAIVPSLPTVAEIEGDQGLLQEPQYRRFANRLEFGPHGRVHNWVDSDMSNIRISPRDPLFWCHHAYVDYVWDRWQKTHAVDGPVDPNTRLNLGSGRTIRVQDVLRIESLEYEYMSTSLRFQAEPPSGAGGSALVLRPESATERGAGLEPAPSSGHELPARFSQAEVRFEGIPYPSRSPYEVRVFLNQPDATRETPTEANPRFLGYFNMLVMDDPMHGRHAAMDSGAFVTLDATTAVRAFQQQAREAKGPYGPPALKLVFLGDASEFRFGAVSLVFRE